MSIYTGKTMTIDGRRFRVADARNVSGWSTVQVNELRNWTWRQSYRDAKIVQIDDTLAALLPA